jgi:hypothetical protein
MSLEIAQLCENFAARSDICFASIQFAFVPSPAGTWVGRGALAIGPLTDMATFVSAKIAQL